MEYVTIENYSSRSALAGEKYRFTYHTIGFPFLDRWQQDAIKKSLTKNPNIEVTSVNSQNGKLQIEFVVTKNPLPLAVVAFSIQGLVVAGIGTIIYLSLSKVEQIINTPEGKSSNVATSLGIAVGVLTLGAFFLKGKK